MPIGVDWKRLMVNVHPSLPVTPLGNAATTFEAALNVKGADCRILQRPYFDSSTQVNRIVVWTRSRTAWAKASYR